MEGMTRSEVAEQSGVGRETVRYYEERGLIPTPRRSASGYRLYNEDDVRRLRFIGRAQELGFTLKEIKELLALRTGPEASCSDVKGRAERKIRDVREKIRDLQRIERALTILSDACSGEGPTSTCPILEAMQDAEALDEALS